MSGEQRFPAVAHDGTQFVVAWVDYRSNEGIEQLRGDVWAMRVAEDGTLLDPSGGLQLTATELPEDLPDVTSAGGLGLVAYSALGGAGSVAEIQRLTYRNLACPVVCQSDLGFGGPGSSSLSVCGDALSSGGTAVLALAGAPPNSPYFLGFATQANPLPLLGGTWVPFPTLFTAALSTDAFGGSSFTVPGGNGPSTWIVQVAVFDASQPQLVGFSNAVQLDFLP